MRVGIDARFYGSVGKGLGRYTEKLLEYLEKEVASDDEFIVFLRKENFDHYQPKKKNFTKVLADYSWYGFGEQILFPIRLLWYRFDLVHFLHFNIPVLFFGKKITTIHDLILFHFPTIRGTRLNPLWYWLKYDVYRGVIWWAIRSSVRICAVSFFTRDDIAKEYSFAKEKIEVTEEGVDRVCEYVSQEEGMRISKSLVLGDRVLHRDILGKYFLYVGNAYPHKNLGAILAAAQAFPGLFFVLVGKEDHFIRELKFQARFLPNVLFPGFVPDRELSWLYRNARGYLFPSKYEGFGLPGLEAMNYGLPVIAARTGSLPEVYGDAAEFFDPEKRGSFLNAIVRIEKSEERRRELQKKGYERIARYDWSNMAKKTYQLYRRYGKNP